MTIFLSRSRKGFTLFELLIVISIIGLLATMIFVIMNPGETLKKGRDAQRFSDLNALHTSIAFYSTTFPDTSLCSPSSLYVTISSNAANFSSGGCLIPAPFSTWAQSSQTSLREIDGTGWLPLNFDEIPGKSPIPALAVDPTNKSGSCPNPAANPADFYYRYACNMIDLTWEIDARLESQKYRDIEDRDGTDGGNYSERFELGRDTDLLPADE